MAQARKIEAHQNSETILASHHCLVLYMSLRRFVRRKCCWQHLQTTVRMAVSQADTKPGEIAEILEGWV